MKKIAVLAMAGLMSITASAANWVQFLQNDRTEFYIDTDSIISSGVYRKAFIKHAYLDTRKVGSTKYNSSVVLYQVDCTSQPMQIGVWSVIFRLNGELVSRDDSPIEWTFAYPDTVSEVISKFVCSY